MTYGYGDSPESMNTFVTFYEVQKISTNRNWWFFFALLGLNSSDCMSGCWMAASVEHKK